MFVEATGGRCARTRMAQTVAERLRREGARVHEDGRFNVGSRSPPLANLRHALGSCEGLPGREIRRQGLASALNDLKDVVPAREDTRRLREAIATAQAAMEVPDGMALTE